MHQTITFVRLTDVSPSEIAEHMSDPRMAEHMPLLTLPWDAGIAKDFVAKKEANWASDGLGHWAFLADGRYVGWGGFQREGDEWDFGLVLRPEAFGLGVRIARQCIDYAKSDERIDYVTFLLPPSRRNLGALRRMGAIRLVDVDYDGKTFLKFRLQTS